MKLSEILWEDIELIPEHVERSRGPSEEVALRCVRMGQPVVLDAVKYLKRLQKPDAALDLLRKESDFFYVRLPVSVRPPAKTELRLLSLDIKLQAESGEAIAWSMEPERVEQEVKTKVNASITSGFKFPPAQVAAKVDSGDEFVVHQPVIEAFNLGASDPVWEFRPASGRGISGVQLLHLIIRQPRNSKTAGHISLRAEIVERDRWFMLLGRKIRSENSTMVFECA